MNERDLELIRPVRYRPGGVQGRRRRLGLWLALGGVAAAAVAVLAFLFAARPLVLRVDPPHARVAIGGPDFHLGENYLVLPGKRTLEVSAAGYRPQRRTLQVARRGPTPEVAIALEPLPGRVEVVSEPPGAEVAVDGEARGVTPLLVEEIPRGPRRFTFHLERYFPEERVLAVEGLGRTQRLEVRLRPAFGHLHLESEPPGAAITVDGRPAGRTPAEVEVLEAGSLVEIAAPGYQTWRARLSAPAGGRTRHPPVVLAPADGRLRLESRPPGAAVTLDGFFAGTAPLELALASGVEHHLALHLPGHRTAERRVRLAPAEERALRVELVPELGEIHLAVTPADAEVRVDGRAVGRGSTILRLPAAPHRLKVAREGYLPYRGEVLPVPGRAQSLEVRLLTAAEAYWQRHPPQRAAPTGTALRLIRPRGATFTLGSPRREPGRGAGEVERRVKLSRPFYLAVTEVTNGEFRRFRPDHRSGSVAGHSLDGDEQPVVGVSWEEAALFCNWLSEREGLPPFYRVAGGRVVGFDWEATGYRLPTEAEWAYVARVREDGGLLAFPWGEDRYPPPAVVENYAGPEAAALVPLTLRGLDDGYPVSAPVGRFPPNPRGLHDLGGNVAEWVNDFYAVEPHLGEPIEDPRGPAAGGAHVVRGASYLDAARSRLRLAARRPVSAPASDLGFRIARYVDRPGGPQ